jgi:hypothetical protein
MKLRHVLSCALVQLGIGAIPHREERGKATQWIVDRRPFLILGGELTNSACASMEYMEPCWPKAAEPM